MSLLERWDCVKTTTSPFSYQVRDSTVVQYVLNLLHAIYYDTPTPGEHARNVDMNQYLVKPSTHVGFCGSLAVTLDHSNYKEILYTGKHKYWLSLKSNGERYQWLCFTYQSTRACVAVDRADRVFLVQHLLIPESLYKGTLFDGDITLNRQSGKREYHIFNLIQLNGVSLRKHTYLERMQIAQNTIVWWMRQLPPNMFLPITATSEQLESYWERYVLQWVHPDAIDIWVKPIVAHWMARHFEQLLMPRWKQWFDEDGCILTPNEVPELPGYQGMVYKLKPDCKHLTGELEVKRMLEPEWSALLASAVEPVSTFCQQRFRQLGYAVALYTYEFVSETKSLPKLFTFAIPNVHTALIPTTSNGGKIIVEVGYDAKEQGWCIVKTRLDKKSANAWPVIEQLIRLVKQPLTYAEAFYFTNCPQAQETRCIPPELKQPGKFRIELPRLKRHHPKK